MPVKGVDASHSPDVSVAERNAIVLFNSAGAVPEAYFVLGRRRAKT